MMNLDWLNEKIPYLYKSNWIYKIICFLLFRPKKKLSYKEYIMILYGINRHKLGDAEAKEKAIIKALDVYKYHHEGLLPDTKEDDEQ